MKTYHVYVDWTTEEKSRPFYVGKGTERRVRRAMRNQLHQRIAGKYGQRRVVVMVTEDENAAFELEQKLIREHKTYVHGGEGWWGANLTLGGEGSSGRVQSSEERAKHSVALQGIKRSEATRQLVSQSITGDKNPNFGKVYSKEEKQRASDAQPGRVAVTQLTLDGTVVTTWRAIREAARELDVSPSHIWACCCGRRVQAGGYLWRYAS